MRRANPGDDDLRRLQRVALDFPGDAAAQSAYLTAWRRAGSPDQWPDRDPRKHPLEGDVVDNETQRGGTWGRSSYPDFRRYRVSATGMRTERTISGEKQTPFVLFEWLGTINRNDFWREKGLLRDDLGRVDANGNAPLHFVLPQADPGRHRTVLPTSWRAWAREGHVVERVPSPWPKPSRPRRSRKNPPAWSRYPRTYVSPRSRELTADEARVRDVTIGLKHGDPAAVEVAAHAMARFVPRGAVLVPAPSSTPGSYSGADVLARRLAEIAGAEVRVLVGRRAPVESSRVRRRAGGKGLTPDDHAASMVLLEAPPAGRPLVAVDNVVVSGATLEGMKRVLGRPDLQVVAYSGAEEAPLRRSNPRGDDRMRDLERRARHDPQARAQLAHEQMRRTHDRGLTLGLDDPVVRDIVQTYLWSTLDNWHDQHEYRAVNGWPNDMALALAAHVVAQDWAAQGNAPASYLADVYAYEEDHEATLDKLRGLTMADLLLVLEHVVPRSERERLLTGAGLLMSEHHANLLRAELGHLIDILWQDPRRVNPPGASRGDDRLRDLERAARAGDVEAGYAVHLERYRRGLPFVPDEHHPEKHEAYVPWVMEPHGRRAVDLYKFTPSTPTSCGNVTVEHLTHPDDRTWPYNVAYDGGNSRANTPDEVQERLRFIYDQLLRTGTFTPWS